MNIIALHNNGLSRVVKIVDANESYDEVLGFRLLEEKWSIFSTQENHGKKVAAAIQLFEKRLFKSKPKAVVPIFSGIACDGSTRNNLREFEFFEKICSSLEINLLASNYATCEKVAVRKLDEDDKDLQLKLFDAVRSFYQTRSLITAGLVRQQILFSEAFFSYWLAFKRKGAALPMALVQANDHSPVRVALSMIMKFYGVPRIYFQHAEVTESFPDLDFEYSILRNIRSLNVYKQIAYITGNTFVISRYPTQFEADKLERVRVDPVTVVVYPTAKFYLHKLLDLIESLKRNKGIKEILIKQHPASPNAIGDANCINSFRLIDSIPDIDHIAVVGNSSIVVELLHRGIPVYQYFGFDPVSPDYYGFCRNRICYEIQPSHLVEKFWIGYPLDSNWIHRYAEWDASANCDGSHSTKEFINAISRLIEERKSSLCVSNRKVSGVRAAKAKSYLKHSVISCLNTFPSLAVSVASWAIPLTDRAGRLLLAISANAKRYLDLRTNIKFNIDQSECKSHGIKRYVILGEPSPAQSVFLLSSVLQSKSISLWLKVNDDARIFSPDTVISCFEAQFEDRSLAVNSIFSLCNNCSDLNSVTAWVILKKALWGNFSISDSEFTSLLVFIDSYVEDNKIRRKLELLLLTLVLRDSDVDRFIKFWGTIEVSFEDFSANKKIELLRWLWRMHSSHGQCNKLYVELKKRLNKFEMLKFQNFEFFEGKAGDYNHNYAQAEFVKLAPRGVVKEFLAHVAPVYARFDDQMKFMEIRIDHGQRQLLLDLIAENLRLRKSYALIRLSDGEGYIFAENKIFRKTDALNRERHWWGCELNETLRSQIRDACFHALSLADVLGVPSNYRFIRDCSEKSRLISQTIQGRGLLEVLSNLDSVVTQDMLITEDKVNVALFTDFEVIRRLSRIAVKTVLVSSASQSSLSPLFESIENLEVIAIPTHHKTNLNDAYIQSNTPLPFVYEGVLERLTEVVVPGTLALVAGGIVGKIMIGHCKALGAVSLDIGHTLDDWIHSRLPALR